ncbi:MAG: SUMF1/EgtB/PvdO family nonheme iron enzyme [Anaerolineae bacterium]|nr:SUMF1/EgtB/PvdO family nonheme iron enzyme [Anaerolineae bacterium]
MTHIFIAYAREYELFATQLAKSLSDIGADVWIDVERIPPGMKWHKAIEEGLKVCELMLVIVTPESMASANVEAEWFYFLEEKKPIIPILKKFTDVPPLLRPLQYIDFEAQKYPEAFQQLHSELIRRGLTVKPLSQGAVLKPIPKQDPLPPSTQPSRNPIMRAIQQHLREVMIGVIVTVIGGIVLAWIIQADRFAASDNDNNEPAPLSGFQILQTTEAELTQSAGTQAAFDLTATEQFVSDSNATATAAQFAATETSAFATLLALSATPTPTPNATATLIAFRPQTNPDWTPIERDFNEVTMVLVPAGCFMMGSINSEDEQPVHEQCFDQPFWIDKYEVTQAQFRRLGGTQANAPGFSGDDRPVERITWFEARDFCELRDSRLPTEAEWEYAARGPDNLVYPWGNTWNASNAVWNRGSSQGTANVGSIPAGVSWIGALDMSGNVWEWTSSLYESYPYDAEDGREADTDTRTDVRRVLRGGTWFSFFTDDLRAPIRFRGNPDYGDLNGGFRCARSYE